MPFIHNPRYASFVVKRQLGRLHLMTDSRPGLNQRIEVIMKHGPKIRGREIN